MNAVSPLSSRAQPEQRDGAVERSRCSQLQQCRNKAFHPTRQTSVLIPSFPCTLLLQLRSPTFV